MRLRDFSSHADFILLPQLSARGEKCFVPEHQARAFVDGWKMSGGWLEAVGCEHAALLHAFAEVLDGA